MPRHARNKKEISAALRGLKISMHELALDIGNSDFRRLKNVRQSSQTLHDLATIALHIDHGAFQKAHDLADPGIKASGERTFRAHQLRLFLPEAFWALYEE